MRKSLTTACIAFAVAALLAPAAGAAPHPGSLDRSFAGGLVRLGFGMEPWAGEATRVAMQGDKAILLIAQGGRSREYSLARLLPDGSPDPGFGTGGYVNGDFGVPGGSPVDLVLQPDGKILVAGGVRMPGFTHYAVSRYTPDGQLDPSFGGGDGSVVFGGKPRIVFGGPGAIALQPDGKIVLSGLIYWEPRTLLQVVRLHPSGAIDRSYGERGFTLIPVEDKSVGPAQALAVHGGETTIASSGEGEGGSTVAQLRSDGSIDRSFGDAGTVIVGRLFTNAVDMDVQADGRVVVAAGRLARLMPDGSLDGGFGSGGVAYLPPNVAATALSLQPDGRVLAAGMLRENNTSAPLDLALARLNPDGSLDPSMGGGSGYVATDVAGGIRDEATDLVQLPGGGALLVGGSEPELNGFLYTTVAAARYGPDGALDPGFAGDGIFSARPLTASRDAILDLAVDAGGNVIATGRGASRIVTSRFLADGRLDPGFGGGGAVAATATGGALGEQGESVYRYPDGRILVSTGSGEGGALLRYLPDGRPDPSFGSNGTVAVTGLQRVAAITVDGQGRIVLVGTHPVPCQFLMVRLDAAGAPDPGFGGGTGVVPLTRASGNCFGPETADVEIAPDGRIFAIGNWVYAFLRAYTPAGERIKGFGRSANGRSTRTLPKKARDLAIDGQGRILVAGSFDRTGEQPFRRVFGLVRLRADGSNDATFGHGGEVRTPMGKSAEIAELGVEPGGRILAAGVRNSCPPGDRCRASALTVARYRTDGALDRSFGKRGIWSKQVGAGSTVEALALGPGTAVLGGWTAATREDRQFLLARLHR